MLTADTRSWAGSRLLSHLMQRLDPASPHLLPLNIRTLHSLVASRSALLSGDPDIRTSLAGLLDKLTSTADLSRTERTQLAGLQYAVRIADR